MKYKLTIGWLYPDLMSTYGDFGNILVLQKRAIWRGVDTSITRISKETKLKDIEQIDLIFGGGAQDMEQEIVMKDLRGKKGTLLKKLIDNYIPALFVCGSPQLMGNYYEISNGQRIEGLGIFDMKTIAPRLGSERLIGNIAAKVALDDLKGQTIVGFENHSGRTYLLNNTKAFAKVEVGFGNNGKDKTEGVVYKNAIGCYFHGPLLPKNPQVADWLIKKSLLVKYNQSISLEPLDDKLEEMARKAIANKLNIKL